MRSKTKIAQIVNTLYFEIIFKNNLYPHSLIKIHIVPKWATLAKMDTNAIQILHTMILKKNILVTVQKAFRLRIKIAKIVISISGYVFLNINSLKSYF